MRATSGTSVCEFEFFEGEGRILAFPFADICPTEGYDFKDAVYMASDLLRMYALDDLAKGREPFWGPLGNKPQNGGIVIAVSVCVDISEIPAVTAAEAARRLGVSTARVSQLCKEGLLDSWRVGATRMVSEESIDFRIELDRRAGRPVGGKAAERDGNRVVQAMRA